MASSQACAESVRRESRRSLATEAIEGSASPRKPEQATRGELDRLRALYSGGGDASLKMLQAAQADQAKAGTLDVDIDMARARIERILE